MIIIETRIEKISQTACYFKYIRNIFCLFAVYNPCQQFFSDVKIEPHNFSRIFTSTIGVNREVEKINL